jgi:hypothetical protein
MNDISRSRKYSKNSNIEFTHDQLLVLSEYDLKKIFINIRSLINKKRRNRQTTKNLEIDLCYIQRELQNRRT